MSKALFPIGTLTKPEVRQLARQLELITAEKKDSQGLCFVGKVRLPEFLMQKLKPKKGEIIEIPADSQIYSNRNSFSVKSSSEFLNPDEMEKIVEPYHYAPEDGKIVGEHKGAHYFTIGQRKGLQVGGTKDPLFVIATDTGNNIIFCGQGDQHRGLYRIGLFVHGKDIHWVREDLALTSGENMEVEARIRYRQDLERARIFVDKKGLYVIFEKPQRGISPGQFVAWYQHDELLGSGIIS